jgi:hypothetical protein
MQAKVDHGWQLTLPPAATLLILGAVIAPMGLMEQATINERGKKVGKLRVTQDQSFNLVKGTRCSVNNHVN